MKLRQLKYFFESYNIPSLRYLYPTNTDLWNTFNKQEQKKTKVDLWNEIEWVFSKGEQEQREIMRYLNQVGIMGALHFKTVVEMIHFLTEMKENIELV